MKTTIMFLLLTFMSNACVESLISMLGEECNKEKATRMTILISASLMGRRRDLKQKEAQLERKFDVLFALGRS